MEANDHKNVFMELNKTISPISNLQLDAPIYVAGHKGLVGSSITRALVERGFSQIITATSAEVDLRDREAVFNFFKNHKPEVVIDAAAKVGGILANNTYPADFLSDNLRIQVNIMDASNKYEVEKLLFLGSSCIYPKFAEQPIKESSLLTGPLEPTNDAYAIAKIAGILQIQASRRQFGNHWISAMPTNLYGPGDNFHPQNSHVLPAMILKFHEAKVSGLREVAIWGSGKPKREFLFVDDLADACLFLLENYDSPDTINVGTGTDISIQDLAKKIAEVVGYSGSITNDLTKPDGTPQKLLDTSKINSLGWTPKTELLSGIEQTYRWFLDNTDHLRAK